MIDYFLTLLTKQNYSTNTHADASERRNENDDYVQSGKTLTSTLSTL